MQRVATFWRGTPGGVSTTRETAKTEAGLGTAGVDLRRRECSDEWQHDRMSQSTADGQVLLVHRSRRSRTGRGPARERSRVDSGSPYSEDSEDAGYGAYVPYEERLEAGRAVILAAAKLIAATRTRDARMDLESLGGRILRALTHRPFASIALLADMADVSSTAISKAVTILDRKGWVGRQQHPSGDYRRRSVCITEAGRRVLTEMEEARAANVAHYLFRYRRGDYSRLYDATHLIEQLANGPITERRHRRGHLGPVRWL